MPHDTEAWAARLAELSTHARHLPTSPRRSPQSAARDRQRARHVGRGGPADGRQPSPRSSLLLAPVARAACATIAQLCRMRQRSEPTVDVSAAAATLVRRLQAIADQAERAVPGDGLRLPVRPDPQALLDRVPGARRRAGSELLRPARLGGAPRQLPGDRQGRRRRRTTGSASAAPSRRSAAARRSISWSGSMFEYLMPALVMRAPGEQPAGPDQPAWSLPARSATRAELGRAVGHLRIRLQRPRPRADLPVLELRRARPRPEARSQRGPRRRAVRDRTGGDDPARGRRPQLRPARPRPAPAGATASARRSTTRRVGCPKDASVAVVKSYMAHHQGMALVALGNVLTTGSMVERFHADPIVEATELLLQERMPRDVLVARPRAEEVKSAADVRDLVPPILRRFTSPHDADPADAPAVERALRGDGDRRRLRLQPLGRPGGEPLARGRHPRSVGQLPLRARHAAPARCGRPATSRAAPRPTATRSPTRRTAPSSRGATARSRPARASSCPPRTTPRSVACR